MSKLSVLKKLAAEMGDRGLLQAAKKFDPSIKSIEDISEAVANKIKGAERPAVRRPADIDRGIDAAEADAFARSVDKGSDVPKSFREGGPEVISGVPATQPVAGPLAERLRATTGKATEMSNLPAVQGQRGMAPAGNPTDDFLDVEWKDLSRPKPRGQASSDGPVAPMFEPMVEGSSPGIKDILKKSGGLKTAGGAAAAGTTIYGLSKQGDTAQAVGPKGSSGPVMDDGLEFGRLPGAPKSLKDTIKGSSTDKPKDEVPAVTTSAAYSRPKVGARPEDLVAGSFAHSDDDYINKLDGLKSRGQGAEKDYQGRVNRAEWGEVADRVAQAAAQYGAARQGLRDNVDMSNVKIQGGDWKSKIDRYGQDLDRENRAIGQERALEKDASDVRRGEAEKQFNREEAVNQQNWKQRMSDWEAEKAAANAAGLKNQELQIQEGKEQRRRKEDLEDFEKRAGITASFKKTDDEKAASDAEKAERKAAEKAEKARKSALQGIAAAISSDIPEKKLKEKIATLGKDLQPEEVQAIMDEDGGWFGRAAPARQELIKRMLTGSSPSASSKDSAPPSGEASSGEIIKRDPKTGRNVRYDAKTKKPLGWVD